MRSPPIELNDKALVAGKKNIFETHESGGHWERQKMGDSVWVPHYVTTSKEVLSYWNYENNKTAHMARNGKILLNNNNVMIMEYKLDDKIITNPDGTDSERIPQKAFWLYYSNGNTKELTNIPPEWSLCTFDDLGNITFINEKDNSFFKRAMEEKENYPIPPLEDCKSRFTSNDQSSLPPKEELENAVDNYYYKNTPIPDAYKSKYPGRKHGWKLLEIKNVNQSQQLIAKMEYFNIHPDEGSFGWGTRAGTYYVFIELNKN